MLTGVDLVRPASRGKGKSDDCDDGSMADDPMRDAPVANGGRTEEKSSLCIAKAQETAM